MSDSTDDMPPIDQDKVIVREPRGNITGVNQKAAEMIENHLKRGRRYFGSSGALLTQELSSPEYKDNDINRESAKELLKKVRSTTDKLLEWMKDKPNVVLVDSVHNYGWDNYELDEETGMISGGYTDHVLIFGSEVVVLDTKDFGKKKKFVVDPDGDILRTNKTFPGGDTKMNKMIKHWLNYLEAGAALTGIIYISGEENSVFRNRNWYMQPFRVVEDERFIDLLNEKWKSVQDVDRHELDPTLISQVVVESIKPYDEYSRVLTDGAIKEFKK